MKKATISSAVLFISCLISPVCSAQYKCTTAGKTTYSDAPCAKNSKFVGEMQDNVPQELALQRQEQNQKETAARARIEGREVSESGAQRRNANRTIEAEQLASAERQQAKKNRCSSLSAAITSNQRGVARYQDFGWQKQLSEQEQELKRNREEYDRECR